MKKTVTIDIAGASYRMHVDADEGHLQRLSARINAKVAELGARAAQRAAPGQLLAMAALSMADELLTLEARCLELEDTTRRAIARIDARADRDGGSIGA